VLKNTTEKWELFVKISIYVITLLKDKICLWEMCVYVCVCVMELAENCCRWHDGAVVEFPKWPPKSSSNEGMQYWWPEV
jgi:hypothetical protein